jgi:hypothetical protein
MVRGVLAMLILKVPALIAAVLSISSVSAQAMEFADRPGPVSGAFNSSSAIRAIASEDRSRRQINNHLIMLPVTATGSKLADRPRPLSNLIRIRVTHRMFEDRPGRLSAEFSAVARASGIRFEYGPGLASSWLKPIAAPTVMKLKHRPAHISNRFKASVAENNKFEDRPGFTSSPAKPTTLFGIQPRPDSAGFCVGSMAPCDLWSFAKRRMSIRSAAHHNERL